MRRASDLFSEEQRKRIQEAVAAAEAKTSAEIVPVVATSSGRYDRPEDIAGLWLAVIAVVALWVALPRQEAAPGSWGGMPLSLELLALVGTAVVAFVVGAVVASRVGWLRRLFTPQQQMQEEVAGRARQIFFDRRIHHTAGATGLLLYVSLFEHIAVVLADQEILDKLGQSSVDEMCGQLTTDLHSEKVPDALARAVERAGERLAAALPSTDGDVNELHDALVLLD